MAKQTPIKRAGFLTSSDRHCDKATLIIDLSVIDTEQRNFFAVTVQF